MRGLAHSDLVMLARRLLGLPEATWEGTVRQMLDRAHTADLYRKRKGRAHPLWGNGSLSAAVMAQGRVPPEPFLSDRRYVAALGAAIDGVMLWRARG